MFSFVGKSVRLLGRATLAASRVVQVGVSAGVVLVAYKGFAVFNKIKEANKPSELPEHEKYLLHLDLTKTTISTARPNSVQRLALGFGEQRRVVYYNDLVKTIYHACDDNQVLGILTTMGGDTGLGFATTKELRDAVAHATAAKKFTAVHVKSIGNVLDSGLKTYYLASAFRYIGIRPTGEVNLSPLRIATPFFRGLLDKLGVEPEFDQRGRYKGFVDQYSSDKFSDGSRRSLSNVLSGIEADMMQDIAASRGMKDDDIVSWMKQGFFLSKEALQKRLINFIAHEDDFLVSALKKTARDFLKTVHSEETKQQLASEVTFTSTSALSGSAPDASKTSVDIVGKEISVSAVKILDINTYMKSRDTLAKSLRKPTKFGSEIVDAQPISALVDKPATKSPEAAQAEQTEQAAPKTSNDTAAKDNESELHKCVGIIELGPNFDVKELQKQFKFARESPAIGAVVFRINSPGGEVQKFETVAFEVLKTRKAGKKVIASMGDIAASGGYLAATYADTIFAMPTTITGSIGVAAGKFAFNGLMEKLGVTGDTIRSSDFAEPEHFNPSAEQLSTEVFAPAPDASDRTATMFERMSETQRKNFARSLDSSYSWFKAQVGVGRKMTPEQVEAVAQGRVWTGRQALENGLVDNLGSLSNAATYTKVFVLDDLEAKEVYIEPSLSVQLSGLFSDAYSVSNITSTVVALATDGQIDSAANSSRSQASLKEAQYIK